MPVVWDADNEARLLMAYIEVADAKLSADGWKAIAEKLGEEATVGAISQRFTKTLKKKYGGANSVLSSGGGGGTTTTTPAKPRGRGGKKKVDVDADPKESTYDSPRKRGASDEADDNDNEPPESPTKKSKVKARADQEDPNDV